MERKFILALVLFAALVPVLLPPSVTTAQGPKRDPKTATGALGNGFTYQGQLQQGTSPVNGTCDLRFALWDSAGDATGQVGSALQKTGVAVTQGLFMVTLDFGSGAFPGDARWLQIAVKCPGDADYVSLSPRQALTASPYALHAADAWARSGNASLAPSNFLGTTDNVSFTLKVNNTTGWRLAPSGGYTPNVIGGSSDNAVTSGVKGATIGGGGEIGSDNLATDDFGTVAGGTRNQAGDNAGGTDDSNHATVGGGLYNTASSSYATVAGGWGNTASCASGTVSGGYWNTAGPGTAVGGGGYNTANDPHATVGGGDHNTARGYGATVGGGYHNTASDGYGATVAGGFDNTASGKYSTVPGGLSNSATMSYTLAAGRRAKANHDGAFVWGDSSDADFASTANNQFLVRANGGVGINTPSPAPGTLTVGGNGLIVGTNGTNYGTTFKKIQAGTATLGNNPTGGVKQFTVNFPSAFVAAPKVNAIARNGQANVDDVFAVTVRTVTSSSFAVNVYRVDSLGATWGQQLQLDWIAWE